MPISKREYVIRRIPMTIGDVSFPYTYNFLPTNVRIQALFSVRVFSQIHSDENVPNNKLYCFNYCARNENQSFLNS